VLGLGVREAAGAINIEADFKLLVSSARVVVGVKAEVSW